MALQSVRRDQKNQGFPPCLSSTLMGDLDLVRELPYRLAASRCIQKPDRWQHPTKCQTNQKSLALRGASTDGKRTLRTVQRYCTLSDDDHSL